MILGIYEKAILDGSFSVDDSFFLFYDIYKTDDERLASQAMPSHAWTVRKHQFSVLSQFWSSFTKYLGHCELLGLDFHSRLFLS